MADISISSLENNEYVYYFPFLPENFPSFQRSGKNEEFQTFNNGCYELLGDVTQISFTLEGIFPGSGKKYSFKKSNSNSYDILNFISWSMHEKKPFRIIIYRDEIATDEESLKKDLSKKKSYDELLNLIVVCESLTNQELRNGDIHYSMSLKEYRLIKNV